MNGRTDRWIGNRISAESLEAFSECGAIENWLSAGKLGVVMCYVYIYTHNIFKYTPL